MIRVITHMGERKYDAQGWLIDPYANRLMIYKNFTKNEDGRNVLDHKVAEWSEGQWISVEQIDSVVDSK